MGVSEKLYPPTIGETLPAFYSEEIEVDGAVTKSATITVPFAMNKAVNINQISGFILKLKTVQNNISLGTIEYKPIFQNEEGQLTIEEQLKNIVNQGIIYFNLTDKDIFEKIRVGQFLKAQIAYITTNNIIGYYSTVGITKYTSKPEISIAGFDEVKEYDDYKINPFTQDILGIYQLTKDTAERPYSYKFYLYEKGEKNPIEESDWILYNSNLNKTSDSLDTITLDYTFKASSVPEKTYQIKFSVKTINNLIVDSLLYECQEINIQQLLPNAIIDSFKFNLNAQNIFDEGYINLFFTVDINKALSDTLYKYDKSNSITENNIQEIEPTVFGNIFQQSSLSSLDLENYYKTSWDNDAVVAFVTKSTNNTDHSRYYIIFYCDKNHIIYRGQIRRYEENSSYYQPLETVEFFPITNPISFEICKREISNNNIGSWQVLKRETFGKNNETSKDVISWNFKDMAIEQGISYEYAFRQYNSNGIHANFQSNKIITADFEDMFLYDGEKQIKLRFNPKISSFKTTRLESKSDTIGNRFPFFFRNGKVNYKEFPISGLISYHLDDNEEFIKDMYEELGIVLNDKLERQNNPVDNFNYNTKTLNLTGYNIKAERQFKLKLMEWLGNGQTKLFKSPGEGNYFIRLLNISLSPEDKLNRMLHSFSCSAYEVAEYNYDNLLNLGFYNIENNDVSKYIGNIENIEIHRNILIGTWNTRPQNDSDGEKNKYEIKIDKKDEQPTGFLTLNYYGTNDSSPDTSFSQIINNTIRIEPTISQGNFNANYYGSNPANFGPIYYVERKGDRSGYGDTQIILTEDDYFKLIKDSDNNKFKFIRNRKDQNNNELSFEIEENKYLYLGDRCQLNFIYLIITEKGD